MIALPPKINDKLATYAVFKDVVSPEGCKQIIELSKYYQKEEGKQFSNPEKRSSDVYWLQYSSDLAELFQRLSDVVVKANNEIWDFNLSGFLEPLQLTHYRATKNGHYDWHMDNADHGILQCRKLSGSLILNEGFHGGNLEFHSAKDIGKISPGTLVIFPSYHQHRVTPITKGERWSLVFWVTGPSWR